MKEVKLSISENVNLAKDIYRMTLSGDVSAITTPGQFINIKLDKHYLRRPISVNDLGEDYVVIIYKLLGHGTEYMSQLDIGTELSVLTGLGNGYDVTKAGSAPLLVGGGVGIPPLYLLAKRLRELGKEVQVVLGFNSAEEVFYVDEFKALGCKLKLATVDGSLGIKGFVTDAMPSEYSYLYTCGPTPMLKAVYNACSTSGQFSFEERMGCGFGACMGCSCKTITGYKRICKDGPVLEKEEILWKD